MISQAVTSRFDISLADVMIVEPGWLRKSTSGKIARGQNRDRYLELKAAANTPREIDPSLPEDVIRKCLFDATGAWVEDADEPLITSGLVDSLALTTLLFNLEDAFQKTLPGPEEAGFDTYDSIRTIADLVKSGVRQEAVPALDLVVDRQVKANYVLEGPRDFDSLIIGSSRSYLVRAKRAAKHGLRAFQFTVASARAEELACIVQFFAQTNKTRIKHIVWGVDPIQFSPVLPIDIRFQRAPTLFSLLEEGDRRGANGLALEDLGTQEMHASKMRVRYNAWDIDHAFDTITGDIIKLFRHNIEQMQTLSYGDADTAGKWPGQFMASKDLTHPHPRRLYYLDKLMRLTEQLGCKLSIFTNPLHPSMASRLKAQTPYYEMQDALVNHLRKIGHSGVSVYNFVTPSDFGGVDADYFDGVHMGRTNGARVLDYVLTKPPKP
jgi:acyl carrier protein